MGRAARAARRRAWGPRSRCSPALPSLKDTERSLALRGTAETLLAIAAAGGLRCCKQSVYLAFETLSRLLVAELELDLPVTVRCVFAERNPECKGPRCRYYPEERKRGVESNEQ